MEAASKRRQAFQSVDEMFLQVFTRLPAPDLGRCSCVCKDWRRLVRRVRRRPTLAVAYIVKMGVWAPRFFSFTASGFLRDDTPPSFDAAITPPDLKSQILVGCNGMIMACIGHPKPVLSPRRGFPDRSKTVGRIVNYLLLNPITGQTSTIPPPRCSPFNSFFNLLVFEPSVSPEQFTIISIEYLTRPEPFLYSSRTGEWRRLEAPAPQLRTSTPAQSVNSERADCHCVGGIGYKIAGSYSPQQTTKAADFEYGFGVNIMAFDVINECLFWVTSPVLIKDKIGSSSQFIGESAGRLAFAYLDPRNCLSVWMLKDCRTSDWLFTHKVHFNDQPRFPGLLWAFAFHPLDADLIFVCFFDRLFLANLKTSELRDIFQGEEFPAGSLFPYLGS